MSLLYFRINTVIVLKVTAYRQSCQWNSKTNGTYSDRRQISSCPGPGVKDRDGLERGTRELLGVLEMFYSLILKKLFISLL